MTNTEPKNIGVKKGKWMVCLESTILELDLSVYEKMVYAVLSSHAQKDGPAFPSIKTIAKEASCSRSKVFEALKKLEEIGLISRGHRFLGRLSATRDDLSLLDFPCGDKDRDGGQR